MDRVKGKVALVTGGASGIGRASAQLLAKEGAVVVVTDVQDDMGKDCVAAIRKAGGDGIYLHHDVASEEAWIAVVAEVKARLGKLQDRKSTRLNSSHVAITYAVFCLKKKNY